MHTHLHHFHHLLPHLLFHLLRLLLLLLLFLFLNHHSYRYTSRELRRLDSVSRSPIYAHFDETLTGVVTIRAFHAEKMVKDKNLQILEANQRVCYSSLGCSNWLSKILLTFPFTLTLILILTLTLTGIILF